MKAQPAVGKMIRGYVVVGDITTGITGKDQPGCITAYTHWYRHDGNMAELEEDLRRLRLVYMNMSKTTSEVIGYEYKDYGR